jgi:hypothetical protein
MRYMDRHDHHGIFVCLRFVDRHGISAPLLVQKPIRTDLGSLYRSSGLLLLLSIRKYLLLKMLPAIEFVGDLAILRRRMDRCYPKIFRLNELLYASNFC